MFPSLVADGLLSGSGEGWDQFAANEKKYNVKSDYREELYTTKLDTKGMSKEQVCRQTQNTYLSGRGPDLYAPLFIDDGLYR